MPAVLRLTLLDELHRVVLLIIGRITVGFFDSARAALRDIHMIGLFREVGRAIDVSSG